MNIEFLPWYSPNTPTVRCGGDDGCGVMLASGDAELHTKWHERISKIASALPGLGI